MADKNKLIDAPDTEIWIMQSLDRPAPRATRLPLPARRHAVLFGLLLLPASIILAIGAIIASQSQLAPTLLALMLILGASQFALIFLALQYWFDAELVVTDEGLTVRRFMNSETYPWPDVASIEVTPATGTLLDNPFCTLEQRIGVGLTLRGTVKSSKETAKADVIIAACDASHAIRMMQLAERIQHSQAVQSSLRLRRQPPKVRQANQKDQFTSRPTPSLAP